MSGAQTSTFTNQLFDPLMAGRQQLQQNALAQGQQAINENEMEQASRAANWIISQDPENKDPAKQAQSYTAALRILRANNFALKSPDAYPGFEAMQYLARSGTPSAEQFKLGQAGTAIPKPDFGPGAAAPGGGGGGGGGAAPNAGGATIGQRQNNPGNLSFAGQPYASPGQGNRFASFPDMPTGVAANADQLALYQTQHGINTVRDAVTKWVSDPKADLTSYIADVAKAVGVGPDDKIDLTDPVVQQKFIQAQFPHESAGGGYVLNPADVAKGVQMAAARRGQQVQPTPAPQVAAAAPPGGVAARTGGTDVAGPPGVVQPPAAPMADLNGPRPLPPTGYGQPQVTPESLANTPAPQNTLAPPAPPAAPAVAPPAATAPAAIAHPAIAPVAIPAPPAMDQNNLTRQDYADLDRARRAGMSGPQLTQEVQQRQVANITRAHQYQSDVRQAQNDAQAANERAIADARAAEQLRLSQRSDARADAEAKRAGLPAGYRLDDSGKAVRIDGLPPDPAVLEQQTIAGRAAQRQFEQENTLRDEFQKLTSDFRIVQTSYENIRSAAKANDGAGDMSLLYNYVRLLDPTSVVRESEFAAAASSGSFGQRVQGAVERVLNGARMPESLRQSFIREGKNLYDNQLRSHNTVADQYEGLARANGLEPSRVVTRFARPQEDNEPNKPRPPGFDQKVN